MGKRAFDIFRFHPFNRFTVALHFDPRDLWVGLYWNTEAVFNGMHLDIFICIVPVFPIHFIFYLQENSE